jgi:hypothetical protein
MWADPLTCLPCGSAVSISPKPSSTGNTAALIRVRRAA